MSPKLEATSDTMDRLWLAIHKATKKDSCKVKVQDLSCLLRDHQNLLRVLRGEYD
jgi:hypothetical protein